MLLRLAEAEERLCSLDLHDCAIFVVRLHCVNKPSQYQHSLRKRQPFKT